MAKTHEIERSAITGRYTIVKKAQQQAKSHVVETIKVQKK